MSVLARPLRVRFPDGAVVRDRRYRTKALGWRSGARVTGGTAGVGEQVLDGALQAHPVFVNVSKGRVGKKEGLVLACGTRDQTAVDRTISSKGEP